jgi:hypothetical protein
VILSARKVRAGQTLKAANIIDTANRGGSGRQQEICDSVEALVLVGNVCELAVEGKKASWRRGLHDVAFEIVDLNAGFQRVMTELFGHIVCELQIPHTLNRRTVICWAKTSEAADVECWKAAVTGHLGYALNAKLCRDAVGIFGRQSLVFVAVTESYVEFVG